MRPPQLEKVRKELASTQETLCNLNSEPLVPIAVLRYVESALILLEDWLAPFD